MRFKKVMKQLKKSNKPSAELIENEELSSPYDEMDFNKTAKAMEMGVSPEEVSDISMKKRRMKQAMERLRLKQDK